eukprot:4395431-Prymnesium_polylepis.1
MWYRKVTSETTCADDEQTDPSYASAKPVPSALYEGPVREDGVLPVARVKADGGVPPAAPPGIAPPV